MGATILREAVLSLGSLVLLASRMSLSNGQGRGAHARGHTSYETAPAALRMRRPMVPRHGVFPVTRVYFAVHFAGMMGSAA